MGPLALNKDTNNHICCGHMLYIGLVIIITASFSDCKTLSKRLRISAKFCHWNPKNSEISRFCRNSAVCGGSDRSKGATTISFELGQQLSENIKPSLVQRGFRKQSWNNLDPISLCFGAQSFVHFSAQTQLCSKKLFMWFQWFIGSKLWPNNTVNYVYHPLKAIESK